MSKKKKTVICGIVVVIIACCIGGGYFIYQKSVKQQSINKAINKIAEKEKQFSETEKRESRLEILQATFEEMKQYNSSDKKYSEVSDKYKEVILAMQIVFTEEYDKIIKDNTIDDLDSSDDIDSFNKNQENLNSLLATVETEKEYTLVDDSKYNEYIKKITELAEGYANRIVIVEEQKKAEEEAKAQKKAAEEAQRKAEERAKTHYENEYFSVDVPAEWIGYWSVSEVDNSTNGIASTAFRFGYNPPQGEYGGYGGGADVYVLDMSDTSRSLSHYSRMIPEGCQEVGVTSSGYHDVFKMEVAAGFFDYGATITLK